MTAITTAALKKQLRELVGAGAALGVNLVLGETDDQGLERLIDNGDELRAFVIQSVTAKARELSVSNQFANEEVTSTYGYLSGYARPKDITVQCNILRQLFPGVGFADENVSKGQVPKGAEGWFAIPKWQTFALTYGEAVVMVLNKLKETRGGKFVNHREGELGPERLRQTTKVAAIFERLATEQKDYDILVVPAQFGIRHRGRSVRRSREVMNSKEFGLGAFAIGIMLLTHPERLQHLDDLWIDCAGDEYDFPDSDVRFGYAPIFSWHDGGLEFGTGWFDNANGNYGSASAFLPQ